jgi:hypothetical protein
LLHTSKFIGVTFSSEFTTLRFLELVFFASENWRWRNELVSIDSFKRKACENERDEEITFEVVNVPRIKIEEIQLFC